MKWPDILRNDRTWSVVSALSGAIAAVAAFGTIYQAKDAVQEERVARRPYFKLKSPGFRDLKDTSDYRASFTFENVGGRPATRLRGKIVLVNPKAVGSMVRVNFSIGNDVAAGTEFKWFNDTVRIPPSATLHYCVVGMVYKDPLLGQDLRQLFVMKWRGMVGEMPFPDFEHASQEERDEVIRELGRELEGFV